MSAFQCSVHLFELACVESTFSFTRATSCASFDERPTPRAAVVALPSVEALSVLRPKSAPTQSCRREMTVCVFCVGGLLLLARDGLRHASQLLCRLASFGAFFCAAARPGRRALSRAPAGPARGSRPSASFAAEIESRATGSDHRLQGLGRGDPARERIGPVGVALRLARR